MHDGAAGDDGAVTTPASTASQSTGDKPTPDDVEELDEFANDYQNIDGAMSPKDTLTAMANEAKSGLQQALLDTMADTMAIVSMQSTDTYKTSISDLPSAHELEMATLHLMRRVLPVDDPGRESSVLYMQRSSGRFRPASIQSVHLSGDTVSVRFDRCKVTKTVPRQSLVQYDPQLLDMPWCYAATTQAASLIDAGRVVYWKLNDEDIQADDTGIVESVNDDTTAIVQFPQGRWRFRTTQLVPVSTLWKYLSKQQDTFTYDKGDICQLTRRYSEKYWSFKKQSVLLHMPDAMKYSKRDRITLLQHYENNRRSRVIISRQQKRNGQYREVQKLVQGQHTPASIRRVYAARRLTVHLTKSDKYLQARISALRGWQAHTIETFGTTPWRGHVWPGNQDPDLHVTEDQISLDFSSESACRYVTGESCYHRWMHVKEFHICILEVVCGPRPLTDHFLKRLTPALLKENPKGRAERPGYQPQEFDAMCGRLREIMVYAYDNGDRLNASEYCELLMAMCAAWEPAARVGEFCCGSDWNPARGDWTKDTLRVMITRDAIADGAVALLMPQPHRKTEAMKSRTAQQRAQRPLVYLDEGNTYHFLLSRAVAESALYSPVDWSTATTEPAFRVSMHDSTPLNTSRVASYMNALYTELFPEKASHSVHAAHNTRIGRIQAMSAAAKGSSAQMQLMNLPTMLRGRQQFTPASGEVEELMNKISGHTTTAGRLGYDSCMLVDVYNLMKASNDVSFTDSATAFEFTRDGSGGNPAVSLVLDADGDLKVEVVDMSPLPPQRTRRRVGKDSRSDTTTARKPAAMPKASSATRRIQALGAPRGYVRRSEQVVATTDPPSPQREAGDTQLQQKLLLLSPRKPAAKRSGNMLQTNTSVTEHKLALLSPRKSPAKRSALARAQWQPKKSASGGKLCETCQLKTANFGLANNSYRKQWCGPCGKLKGAVNPGRVRAMTQAEHAAERSTSAWSSSSEDELSKQNHEASDYSSWLVEMQHKEDHPDEH